MSKNILSSISEIKTWRAINMHYSLHAEVNNLIVFLPKWVINPNTIKSYKISQKLSPKHAAHGVAQLPYPIYRHGKACLSKQPTWHAAGDPRLAHGRSRVWAPAPAGALCTLFSPPSLPPLGDSFFLHLPHQPHKGVKVIVHHWLGAH